MQLLEKVFAIYTKAVFKVKSVHADPKFRPVLDLVETSLGAKINYCNRAEHVPEAKRNNRVIQERTQATFHQLHINPSLNSAQGDGYGKYKMLELFSSEVWRV